MPDERDEARQVYQRYERDELTASEAAQQLAALLGDNIETQDQKLEALRDELEPLTTLPCVITATAATSCSRWCD